MVKLEGFDSLIEQIAPEAARQAPRRNLPNGVESRIVEGFSAIGRDENIEHELDIEAAREAGQTKFKLEAGRDREYRSRSRRATSGLWGSIKRAGLRLVALGAEALAQLGFNALEISVALLVINVLGLGVTLASTVAIFAAIFAFSLAVYRLWIAAYDRAGEDIYLMERLKRRRDGSEKSFIEKFPDAFAISAIWPGDAVLSTILMRRGIEEYNGMSRYDWAMLLFMTALDSGMGTLLAIAGVGSVLGLLSPAWAAAAIVLVTSGLLYRFARYMRWM